MLFRQKTVFPGSRKRRLRQYAEIIGLQNSDLLPMNRDPEQLKRVLRSFYSSL